jgi:hypothetical protein
VNPSAQRFRSKYEIVFELFIIVFIYLLSGQLVNDGDLAAMRSQCNRYSQQIDALQAQMPSDVQKVSR